MTLNFQKILTNVFSHPNAPFCQVIAKSEQVGFFWYTLLHMLEITSVALDYQIGINFLLMQKKKELFETLLLPLVLIDGKLHNRLYYNRALQLHHSVIIKTYILLQKQYLSHLSHR